MKYQVAIIGGGPAGYTAAEAAGKAGLSVVLFEKQSLGGVCLNEGCIPTKTLLYSAKTYDGARHAAKYAVSVPEVSFDLPKIIARKQKVVRKLVLGVKGKLTAHGVTIVSGEATVTDKNHVECGGETYECENLLLCTGSETFVPAIPGIDKVPYWTHRDALDNKELPASLAIIGGGPAGLAAAAAARKAGVEDVVRFEVADMRNFRREDTYGQLVTNPPYGERLLERQEAEALYRDFGKMWERLPDTWRTLVLSSHTEFERTFGHQAKKKRKLYNGMIKCDLFMYGNV